jgi:spondin-1
LLGSRTHNNFQQFVRFQLTGKTVTSLSSPKYVGRFQLFSDSLTKFSDECINTVVEADDLPKSEVQAMWVAPKTGSGCIALSAMIFEDANRWYANEGALQKTICEKRPDIGQIQQECCACNEAKYNVSAVDND